MDKKIAESTIYRLSRYYRSLGHLIEEGKDTISSDDLAEIDGITSAQVRKDLSFFGSFGKRGLGYNTRLLRQQIAEILGLTHPWNLGVVGAGNIGRALCDYQEFKRQNFLVKALFDADPDKIGTDYHGVPIFDYNRLEEKVKELDIQIGVIAVPAERAQEVADRLVAAGIKAILNFAPKSIKVDDDVKVRYENMAIEVESLTYFLRERYAK
ncbi:MAG: redox-sensing transcriptional repressor Rex [Calditrichia bacterium]